MSLPFQTLLLTGAAGYLGRTLAPGLLPLAARLRVSDLAAPLTTADLPAAAERVPCDLADARAVHGLLAGVDAVVHLGGVAVEGPWDPILQANVRGLHHLYEAARRQGVKRVVFASSNHVTGCYEQAQTITPQDPPRPDGNYGLSKLFGEGIASLYWDRHGVETVCIRIGTALPTPPDRRALATWLSLPDLLRLHRARMPEAGAPAPPAEPPGPVPPPVATAPKPVTREPTLPPPVRVVHRAQQAAWVLPGPLLLLLFLYGLRRQTELRGWARKYWAEVRGALTAPQVGFLVTYGISNNTRRFYDSADAWARLGYQPQDDAEAFASQVAHILQPEGPQRIYQGGAFMGIGPFDD